MRKMFGAALAAALPVMAAAVYFAAPSLSALAAEALGNPGTVFKDCSDCPDMVVVGPGSFTMGTPEGWTDIGGKKYGQADEQPEHKVNIAYKFAMGKYEVTVAEYRRFAEETKRVNSDTCLVDGALDDKGLPKDDPPKKGTDWRNPGFKQTDRDPVVCVAWNDAKDYVNWLSAKTGKKYRLPSESEWEYSAKAGTNTLWFWGNDPNASCEYANLGDLTAQKAIPGFVSVPQCNDGYVYSAPVGSFKPNAFGLYDMVANAQEWLEDCSTNSYKGAPADGSAWIDGGDCDYRIYRSGTFSCTLTCNVATVPPNQVNNVQPSAVGRAANRDRKIYSYRSNHNGFRIARSK